MALIFNTSIAIFLFAANSVLCRMALADNSIDASSFTTIRLVSGALTLFVIFALSQNIRHKKKEATHTNKPLYQQGSWLGGLSLFIYAAGFSFAYRLMDTGTGALILFSSVQLTILAVGYWQGTRFSKQEWLGILLAFSGFAWLFLPQLNTPALGSFFLMSVAGIAWGAYTLLGRKSQAPLADTTANFFRALPYTLLFLIVAIDDMQLSLRGVILAVLSGAIASGIGYSLWYASLSKLSSVLAALLQLMVPLIATAGGVFFTREQFTSPLLVSSLLVIGGIVLVVTATKQK